MSAPGGGPAPVPASGVQHALSGGGYDCVVTQVGASLRRLRHGGRDLVVPFDADQVRPVSRGELLAPWPGRVADGRWRWHGEELQLPLTEVGRRTALHGLVAWLPWTPVDAPGDGPERPGSPVTRPPRPGPPAAASLTLACRLHPRPGYPFRLDLLVRYALAEDGLTTTLRATNSGDREAPYGCSAHPYLVAGPGRVDDWALHVPATRVLRTDPERLLPERPPRTDPIPEADLAAWARRLGATRLDHSVTGLAADADGRTAVRVLHSGTGTGVELSWQRDAMPWAQLHTADRPEPGLDRVGLAVEPMTCPPDALGSGTDLVRLAPGESHSAAWTIAMVGEAVAPGG